MNKKSIINKAERPVSPERLDTLIKEREEAVVKYPNDNFLKLTLTTFNHQKGELIKTLKK